MLISGRGLLASSKQSVILRKSNCFHFSVLQELGAKGFPEANLMLPPRDSKPCVGRLQNLGIQQAQMTDASHAALSAFVWALD